MHAVESTSIQKDCMLGINTDYYSQRQGEPCSSSRWDLLKDRGREKLCGRISGSEEREEPRSNLRESKEARKTEEGKSAEPYFVCENTHHLLHYIHVHAVYQCKASKRRMDCIFH